MAKKKVGAPTLYKGEETIKKSLEYIESCKDEDEKVTESENEQTGRTRYTFRYKVKLPKAEGLAIHLGVSRKVLYDWAERHEEFGDILELINKIQVDRVFNEALAGRYNATIAKLLLAKHGYKESSETDITSGGKSIGQILDSLENDKTK